MYHLFSEANDSELLNISLIPTHATPRGKSCREFYSVQKRALVGEKWMKHVKVMHGQSSVDFL